MMAIVGLGTDLIEISRIEQIIERSGDHLAKRILSNQEWLKYKKHSCQSAARFLAKRFAVKEASIKALGTGIQNGFALNQFEVFNNHLGKPILIFLEKARILANSLGVTKIHISLSDEQRYACAIVILEN